MFGLEHIKDVRPRFDAGGDSWVPTEALRQRRLLGLLVEHHDLRPADPRSRRTAAASSASRSPATSSRRTGSARSRRRSSTTTRLPKNPGLAGNITDSTLPETADYNSLTGPRRPEDLRTTTGCSPAYSWHNRDSIYNEYTGLPRDLGHLVPVPVVAVRGRRRPRRQPDDRAELPVRLQPLRPQLGAAGRGAELRPDAAGLPVAA
ncbi:MAG: hypothetical protein MZW92_42335 [Comamonadaceae bacterium]|nr:hypothetical protein [Comamonadaceae bacterium]